LDALLPAFLAALLAEIGDKTQLLTVLLAARFARPGQVLAGVAVAALANSLIAATGGTLVAGAIPFRALNLLTALALIFAASGALLPQKQPEVGIYDRFGPFAASAIAFFILELGDKTQFLTFAFAARSQAPLLAAFGATAGIVVASLPAIAIGAALPTTFPLRQLRFGVGIVFLIVGLIVGLSALRLL
jgi:putative Ca2+/H+ antiporter (TMEM165/GDT1 family)